MSVSSVVDRRELDAANRMKQNAANISQAIQRKAKAMERELGLFQNQARVLVSDMQDRQRATARDLAFAQGTNNKLRAAQLEARKTAFDEILRMILGTLPM